MKALQLIFVFCIAWVALVSQCSAKIPDPYRVLGVAKEANEDQIKQGFKKRSKKYHPDRNKVDPRAKEKFAKIVNAYELLKDPERRRMYDLTGDQNPNGQQQGGHGFPGGGFQGFPGGINIEDLIGGFGGGFGGFGGHPGGQQRRPGGQQQGGRRASYSFSFGGGPGMQFQF